MGHHNRLHIAYHANLKVLKEQYALKRYPVKRLKNINLIDICWTIQNFGRRVLLLRLNWHEKDKLLQMGTH